MQALLELPGYEPTHFEGGRAEFEAGERRLLLLSAEGSQARVRREGNEIAADSAIIYDEESGRVRSSGATTFTPEEGDPVTSETMIFDLEEERGSALGAETRYTQGANWIVRGDMPYVDGDVFYGDHMRFTSCELDEPHYHFEADEIKIVNDRVLVARPVRLYFADVPVAWLPFIAQGLGSGRSSGLLTPRFSVNDIVRTSRGYRRRISNMGFYWAMSEYTDATTALDWFSGEFLSLTSAFRYSVRRKFLQGDVNYRQYWREEGGQELAFDTRHSWEYDERTQLRVSARYASSTDFVRRNSFDPREVTQSIDSDGGLNRRFDWGNLSLSANRRQFLSDDRVEMTLPTANLSLSTITLFRAPASQAKWYNNLTWSGGGSLSRRITDLAPQDTSFSFGLTDKVANSATFRSSLNLGPLSLSQNLTYNENVVRDVPDSIFAPLPDSAAAGEGVPPLPLGVAALQDLGLRDLAQADLTWTASVSYQQRLIGSTTLTPSLSISGRALRSDSIPEAESFQSAPSRVSVAAQLKTDLYGFFPGFGRFDAIRHKLSPSFSWSYSPSSTPSDLQQRVFGSREIQPRNVLTLGINQTWEARLRPEEEEEPGEESPAGIPGDSAVVVVDSMAATTDSTALPVDTAGPRRPERSDKVKLLGIQTSVLEYDFVEADSAGDWTAGFTTTRLRNTISSDFLRGLNISVEHDLFENIESEEEGRSRSFAPHLSQLNLSFRLDSRSGLARALGGLLGGSEEPPEDPAPEEEEGAEGDDPFAASGAQETEVVPGLSRSRDRDARSERARSRRSTGWNADISYSLRRPREGAGATTQMAQGTLSFSPTERWTLNWRTSFDLEAGSFNDHMIRLTRDLHRWEASFDFRQTATGNWTFRFEVSLTDNRDLKFDYSQRNLEDQRLPLR
jgi:hypothetical protein